MLKEPVPSPPISSSGLNRRAEVPDTLVGPEGTRHTGGVRPGRSGGLDHLTVSVPRAVTGGG